MLLPAAHAQALPGKLGPLSKETTTKWMLLPFLFIALCAPAAHAQSSVTANSCSQSDVNAVINGPKHIAVNGDTINIPAGTCTWTSGITVPSGIGISIIGSGTPNTGADTTGAGTVNTIIMVNQTSAYGLYLKPKYGNALTHISLIEFDPASGLSNAKAPLVISGTCASGGCPNVRVDNLVFGAGWAVTGLSGAGVTLANNLFGVYDHNTVHGTPPNSGVVLANLSHSAWMGVGQFGDNSWAQPDTFGTNQALYIENNSFDYGSGADDTDAGDSFGNIGGGRFVCRYNVFNNTGIGGDCLNHGTETTGRPRGGRQMEVYGNTFICTNTSSGCGTAVGVRSGALIVFNNTYTAQSGAWFNKLVSLSALRAYRGPASSWGTCDGTGPYDQNDGMVYASGKVTTGGGSTLSDSGQNWTINQWAGSAATNGTPYSIHNLTQNFGSEISSNTATQYTLVANPCANNGCSLFSWNVGDSYQILRAPVCIDQPGRGQGRYISGSTPSPTGWVNEVLDPVYEWNDTITGTYTNQPFTTGTSRILENRDYYRGVSGSQTSPSSPFSGTAGVGWGTLANRPTTCTPAVGYWATDQNTLYKCTATDSWTGSYQPFTYPHPLTNGSGGGTGSTVNPPTGLTATVQ